MIKQLLVGIDKCGHAEAAARYACSLAKIHDAQVLGIAMVDTEGIEASYHTARPLGAGSADVELYKRNLQEAKEGAQAALEKFKSICEEAKVKCRAEIREGNPSRELVAASRLNDIVVLGKNTRMTFGTDEDESCNTWWEVLTLTERPLILTPDKHREVKNVMIAVDYHRLTDRLFFNYIHLNPYPGAKVHLVHAAKSEKHSKDVPAGYVDYFKTHNIEAIPRVLFGEHPGQAIVNYANTENIDMVVVGVHTMSKVWAALLGSTARFVIDNLDVPIYAQT